MKINMKGLINQLDDLRERLNELFDKLENLDDFGQEAIAIEDVEQHFQNDDTFNLSIALDVLVQAEKLDKVLEIIKPFLKNIRLEENEKGEYEILIDVINSDRPLVIARVKSNEEFNLLKEVLL